MEIYALQGRRTPAHSHSKTTEALYVVEDEAVFAAGDRVRGHQGRFIPRHSGDRAPRISYSSGIRQVAVTRATR